MNDAEKKLWRDQITGLSFRRQHPVGTYVRDFYCPAIRLAGEVDGGQHDEALHRANDDRRTRWLASQGIIVLRFWNNEILGNVEGVWAKIARISGVLNARRSSSLTLPLSGGGN